MGTIGRPTRIKNGKAKCINLELAHWRFIEENTLQGKTSEFIRTLISEEMRRKGKDEETYKEEMSHKIDLDRFNDLQEDATEIKREIDYLWNRITERKKKHNWDSISKKEPVQGQTDIDAILSAKPDQKLGGN